MDKTSVELTDAGITDHHDGFGLNEGISILCDEKGAGDAPHRYVFKVGGKDVADIQFQHGPRNEETSEPGVTTGALLALLIHQTRCYQDSKFKCRENALVLTHLEEALHWVHHRARDRAKRQVLGSTKV